jgi:hypothetical protein
MSNLLKKRNHLKINSPGTLLFTLLIIVCCLTAFISCRSVMVSLGLKVMGVYSDKITKSKAGNGKREVHFIEMHHIGTRGFYDSVAKQVNQYRQNGYRIYYELVKLSKLSPDKIDTNMLKYRKIFGNQISKGGYLDSVTHKLMGIKIINGKKLVNQPPYAQLGVKRDMDQWADVTLGEIVIAYEKKYGIIALDSCDFATKLLDYYPCDVSVTNKESRDYYFEGYRNEHVVNLILNDTASKILLVYGTKHVSQIVEMLQKKDSAWKYIY